VVPSKTGISTTERELGENEQNTDVCVEESRNENVTQIEPVNNVESPMIVVRSSDLVDAGKSQESLQELRKANHVLKEKLNDCYKELNALKIENKTLKKELEKNKRRSIEPVEFVAKIKNIFKGTLSSNQIDLIMKEKKRVQWTIEEISSALTLRYFGKRAYRYIAIDLHYPLPALSTLQKYARKINLKQGVLVDVLVFIGNFSSGLPRQDRECILSFDEMKVQRVLEYDQSTDEILGPHDYIQVVMARGLFRQWKQPVFIGFDTKMTKEIMVDLIQKLNEKGVNVAAIVSDNCSANIGCWKQLGAHDYFNPHFEHPITKKNVYIMLMLHIS